MNDASGLSESEVRQRRTEFGPNAMPEPPRRGLGRMLASQFADTMVLVLLVAAAIAALVGEAGDVAAIVAIIVLDTILGVTQEYRAENAMAALRRIAAPTARVVRDGLAQTIPAADLVPGDFVLLEAGTIVPADLRLSDAARLTVDESMLTGESYPALKDARTMDTGATPSDERVNAAFQGTRVTAGRGAGSVVATGARTELGRIAELIHTTEDMRTPLQMRLARLGQRLAIVALALCTVIFALGVLRGEPPGLMFLTALSLAVAAIPEALPAVVTLALAMGARRLARQHALIRQLPAVETLGSVTFICTDKTGTLTENRMRADALPIDGAALPPRFYEAIALCNDVEPGSDGKTMGDPTETALHALAAEHGYGKAALAELMPRIAELPFSPDRARMTTIHRAADGAGYIAFTKGAPERVIAQCVAQVSGHTAAPIDREQALGAATTMAHRGLRVLAVAMRALDSLPADMEQAEHEQQLLGLVALHDPPRAEANAAVAACRDAHINVVMITGDHPHTALAIARDLGIAQSERELATGAELRAMSDAELARRIEGLRVYARVGPEEKLRIVTALQARGECVAMTGDGVNDAPALRRANIGVAMGRGGTDVAREASAMVLLDDNFATIVSAVREGRRIYENIRKFVRYVLAGNTGEITTLLLAPLIGLPTPLLPIHILYVNLVTDGLPGLALTAEPEEDDLMRHPPRPPSESVFARGLAVHVLWVGLLIGAVTIGVQAWAFHTGDAHWQSMTFTVLTLAQMGQVLAIRSDHTSFFRRGLRTNLKLAGAVALTAALQLIVLYTPAAQRVFHTQALSARELAIAAGASVLVFGAIEMEKWVRRSRTAARA